MSAKRPRPSHAPTPSAGSSRSSSPSPSAKQARAGSSKTPALLCTLPPTCNPPHNKPTELANSKDLETHYANFHAHVCEEKGCGAVFPDARLLELHQTECHDPLAAVRMEKGEKIFACHLQSCPKLFQSPKNRRLHLIQAHNYPKEYFFAVTNKGVGGLLKKWGEGASLIRREWKPRETDDDDLLDVEDKDEEHAHEQPTEDVNVAEKSPQPTKGEVDVADTLAASMDSLSLVPSSIRFGRGGRSGRVVRQGHGLDSNIIRHIEAQATQGGKGGAGGTAPSGTQPAPAAVPGVKHGSERGRGQGRGRGMAVNTTEKQVDAEGGHATAEPVSINIDGALDALLSESKELVKEKGKQSKTRPREPPTHMRGRGLARGRAMFRGGARGGF